VTKYNIQKLFPRFNYDTFIYVYFFFAGTILLRVVWDMGLYGDDYWNLHDVNRQSFLQYFLYHLKTTNSRYLYPVFNKILTVLFYNKNDLFGILYTRASHVIGILFHIINCFLAYRILRKIGVKSDVASLFLPPMLFPLFGKQAIFWIAAYIVHTIGLTVFLVGFLFVLQKNRLAFTITMFIAFGCSEFVFIPNLLLCLFLIWTYWKKHNESSVFIRIKHTIKYLLPLSIPFIVYILIVFTTKGAQSRIDTVGSWGYPKIWEQPWRFLIIYLSDWPNQLQPFELLRENPFITLLFVCGFTILANSISALKQTGIITLFYAGSFFPMAVVGYPPFHSRLYYISGMLFLGSCAIILSNALKRFNYEQWNNVFRRILKFTVIIVILISTQYYVTAFLKLSIDSARAYSCIKNFIEHIGKEAGESPPKSIDVCGFSPSIDEFQVVGDGWTLPCALSLYYKLPDRLPVRWLNDCPESVTPFWYPQNCSMKIYYRIVK
jgi:hypothetical protein